MQPSSFPRRFDISIHRMVTTHICKILILNQNELCLRAQHSFYNGEERDLICCVILGKTNNIILHLLLKWKQVDEQTNAYCERLENWKALPCLPQ